MEAKPRHKRGINIAIVLEVPQVELEKRLNVRGRVDGIAEAIEERLRIYRQEIDPILDYLTDHNIKVAHIDGMGTVGQVHDRIEAELEALGLVESAENPDN